MEILLQAADCLQQGGIVAIPTETYYGLAVDPFNEKALQALFYLKKRDVQKPILVLIGALRQLTGLAASVPLPYQSLMDTFWPGPLTLIFPGHKDLSPLLTGGTGNIGVRFSSNPIATHLCRIWGRAITATSANISGMPPASKASEVRKIFGSKIDYIIDGGRCPGEASSTVVGIRDGCIELVREGKIDFITIQKTLGM
jgi:L-threonylcarbamoyladenylate synthase